MGRICPPSYLFIYFFDYPGSFSSLIFEQSHTKTRLGSVHPFDTVGVHKALVAATHTHINAN